MRKNFSFAVWFKAFAFTLIWKCHGSLQPHQSEFNGLEYIIKMRLLEKCIAHLRRETKQNDS